MSVDYGLEPDRDPLPPRWVDKWGDVWQVGDDGLLHTPETAPFPREYVERKWGPLRELSGDGLLEDLAEAERANIHARSCQVCDHLAVMSPDAHAALSRALAGTIGVQTLADILTRNGYPTGRRAIMRHRKDHP